MMISSKFASQVKLITALARRWGIHITLTDMLGYKNVYAKEANGLFTGGNHIVLDVNADYGLLTAAFTHEAYHYLEEKNKTAAEEMRKLVFDMLGEEGAKKARKEMRDRGYAEEYIDSEIVADSLFDALSEKGLMKKITSETRMTVSEMLSYLADSLKYMLDRLTGSESWRKQLRSQRLNYKVLSQMFERGMDGAENDAKRASLVEDIRGEKRPTVITKKNTEKRYSYAGEKARNANFGTLPQAKNMIADGQDGETVRKETGWFKGYDGKWRFEIDDSKMKIIKDNLLFTTGNYKMSDIISHPGLFEAYPEIGDTNVCVGILSIKQKDVAGFYNRKDNTLYLNRAIYLTDDMLKELITHELQHKIQSIEDFARGSSPEYWKQRGISESEYLAFKEKTETEFRRKMNALSDVDKKDVREYYRIGKIIDKRLSEIDFSDFDNASKVFDEIAPLEKTHDALYDKLYNKPWFDRINELYYQTEVSDNLNTVFYKNTAGEIEARDVSNRLNLTDEQRKNTRPDIDRTDVVFADGGDKSFSTKDDVLKLDSVDWMDNFSSIKDQLIKNSEKINKMSPVCVVSFNPGVKINISELILDTVKQLGGKNIKNKNVTFVFDEKGTNSILLHAKSAELQAAALAAPYVAKYGDLIAGQKSHESTGLTTLTFAAPVIINGDTVNVGVAVQFQSNGKPRAVNVELQSGGKFVFDAKKVPAGLDSRVERYVQGTSLPTTGTDKSIPQTESKVKPSDENSSDTSDKNPTKRESKKKTSVSDEVEKKYLELAKHPEKNKARLREMVDEAANRAGYRIRAYHGTGETFTKFAKAKIGANYEGYLEYGAGFYFTPSREEARKWAANGEKINGNNVMSVYLAAERMMNPDESISDDSAESILKRHGYFQNDIEFTLGRGYRFIEALIHFGYSNAEIQKQLKAMGYDGVDASYGKENKTGQYVIFDPEQVKSADIVTYDDEGNIIPLSERFRTDRTDAEAWKNKDIRFSKKKEAAKSLKAEDVFGKDYETEYAEANAEIERLKRQVALAEEAVASFPVTKEDTKQDAENKADKKDDPKKEAEKRPTVVTKKNAEKRYALRKGAESVDISASLFSATKITSINSLYHRFYLFSMKSRKRDEIRAMLG